MTIEQLDAIDEAATQLLRKRMEEMGETESGAYPYYAVRVNRGRLINPAEIELLNYIIEREKEISSIHDIGAGIGTLAIAFAAAGIEAVAIERDERRLKAMNAIVDDLRERYPKTVAKVSALHAPFPDPAIAAIRKPDTVAVAANFIASMTEELQQQIVAGFAEYPTIYIDAQRFCISRSTQEEYDRMERWLLDSGFSSGEKILDLGVNAQFYRFER